MTELHEKLGAIDAKAKAAHDRLDRMELLVREDLSVIRHDLKDLLGWMNRGKGWAAASLFMSSIVGGLIMFGLTKIF